MFFYSCSVGDVIKSSDLIIRPTIFRSMLIAKCHDGNLPIQCTVVVVPPLNAQVNLIFRPRAGTYMEYRLWNVMMVLNGEVENSRVGLHRLCMQNQPIFVVLSFDRIQQKPDVTHTHTHT